MPPNIQSGLPDLSTYLRSLKEHSSTTSVENLISLLQRRQIRGSRPCAIAVTHLFIRIVAELKFGNVGELLQHIRATGKRLETARPQEFAIGNIFRRVLGLVREVTEGNPAENKQNGTFESSIFQIDQASYSEFQKKNAPADNGTMSMRDLREDVLNGLREILDELDQADEQVAGYALDHIYANETIMTHTSSLTVQKFLLNAAKRRKFTLIQVEGYPNEKEAVLDTVLNGKIRRDQDGDSSSNRLKPLTSMGVTVIVIPDSAVFALMPRVNKVLLPLHAAFPNGGFTAASGSHVIAQIAKLHSVPVVSLGAVYKLSPLYPYDIDALSDNGDAGKTLDYREAKLLQNVHVINPMTDYIPPELVSLFITNIGAHATSYLYRIIADHYRNEDVET